VNLGEAWCGPGLFTDVARRRDDDGQEDRKDRGKTSDYISCKGRYTHGKKIFYI
jgi:hypothetical protein